ncbi:ABC transporter ATP-binding protein [Eisenbergiella tayi]|uniref:ABC transporter ATP-binding protein n=1 Tax=Eisenbergiella tayi TaxID=1432052 RepID=UPI0009BF2075|nr:ABC transporter ATP-binding protein [Eisenbergiella tayi]
MDILKKINYIFSKKEKIQMALMAVVIIIGAFWELMGVSIIMPVIQVIMSPSSIHETAYLEYFYRKFHFSSDVNFMVFLAAILIIIYIIKNLYISIMYNLQYHFTFYNQRKMAHRMLDCYMCQPYYFHVSHGSSELMRNINGDTNMLFQVVLAVMDLCTEFSVCLVLGAFLLIQDKSITIGLITILVVFLLLFAKTFQKYFKKIGGLTRRYSAETTKWLQQSFGGIKETKILGREEFFVKKFDYNYRNYASCERKYRFLQVAPRPVLETICICGLMLVVIFKLLNGTNSTYFVKTLSVFAIAAFRLLPSFNRIANFLSVIMFNKPAVDAVYKDLKEIEAVQKTENEDRKNSEKLELENEINIRNLCFHYPDTEKYVLENVNFNILKNQSVAFIGPSGAGKTTMADILLGALDPTSGQVLVDGKDISGQLNSWQKNLGYIPQAIYLMDDTIGNNIAYGIAAEDIDQDKLNNAIEQAQLRSFVESLEFGLETEVGERGVRLSGGQRQRIGIARALYNNPDVLILDEATSALDNDTEKAVMEAIENLSGSKTLIIIAHRLSTIKNCDVVFEVRDNQVVQVDKEEILRKEMGK